MLAVKDLNRSIVAGSYQSAATKVDNVIATALFLPEVLPFSLKMMNVGVAHMTRYTLFARESIPKYEKLYTLVEIIVAMDPFDLNMFDLPDLDLHTFVSWWEAHEACTEAMCIFLWRCPTLYYGASSSRVYTTLFFDLAERADTIFRTYLPYGAQRSRYLRATAKVLTACTTRL